MKNLIFTLTLLITMPLISCKAQIIPIEDLNDYPTDVLEGDYIKDVNNLLDKFTGTWKGEFNNNLFTLYITKGTFNHDGILWDILYIRYKVQNVSSGDIIADTTGPHTETDFIMEGYDLQDSDTYILTYFGLQCGQGGDVYIWFENGNVDQLYLSNLWPYGFDDCSDDYINLFPVNEEVLLLEKQ